MTNIQREIDWIEVYKTPPIQLANFGREGLGGGSISQAWGESFRELSPFVDGASTRRIHWPTFINTSEYVIKNYDLPQRSTLWILLDETASMKTGQQWLHARKIAIKLAVGVLKSGHHLQFIIDRNHQLQSAPLITRLDQLLNVWMNLINEPNGCGASIYERSKYLAQIPSLDALVCLSDAIVTVQGTSEPKGTATEQLITVVEQLKGALSRIRHTLYICLIDEKADQPSLHQTLRSPENHEAVLKGPLNIEKSRQAVELIQHHRTQQQELLKAQGSSSWIEYKIGSSFDLHFNHIVKKLSLS